MLFLYLLIVACLAERWLEDGRPDPSFKGKRSPIRAVLSTPVGCPTKLYPGLKEFLDEGLQFSYDIHVRYRPRNPEIAFYEEGIQQAPAIDLANYTREEIEALLRDAGVPRKQTE